MKTFKIPAFYESSLISKVKQKRKSEDPRKMDFSPSVLDFGAVEIVLARHFGFCYGVENAIEIAYKALDENPGKRILLLSQMIHNPDVNKDLEDNGIGFIQDTYGKQLMSWDDITADDVLIIPAFGTTIELEALLKKKGIPTEKYNTTCPFVEKVWNRSEKLGKENNTVIIHGKPSHEETRATFSHSSSGAKSIVIKDMNEAILLASFIKGERDFDEFDSYFKGRYSSDFNPNADLNKVGVVNQTTMLASETQAIADYFKTVMENTFGNDDISSHFTSTRDTLCYATNDNQKATFGLLKESADLAIVVGGYNSSNTSHLVELCEEKVPTFFVKNASEIKSAAAIHHYDWRAEEMRLTENWIPKVNIPRIIITSGASCPDAVLEKVLRRLLEFFPQSKTVLKIEEGLT